MSRKAKRKCERRPAAFKQMAVERMKEGKIRALGKELGVPVSGLYRWKQQAEGRSAAGVEIGEDAGRRRVQELEKKVKELEGVIGQKTLELDFFAAALRRIKESRRQRRSFGETASTPKSAGGWKRKAD
jgi:transposase-like protein